VLGWAVLCGTAGVMIGSALVADPPVDRTELHHAGMFPVGLTLAGGGTTMATTSFALPAGVDVIGAARQGCIVVPSGAERYGGEVRLSVRTPLGSEARVLITVDRGSGSRADCADFEVAEMLYRGPADRLDRRHTWDAGLAVADADDGELTIRVEVEPTGTGTVGRGAAGGTTWLDVQHRLTPDR
jgi:hypothetical protein